MTPLAHGVLSRLRASMSPYAWARNGHDLFTRVKPILDQIHSQYRGVKFPNLTARHVAGIVSTWRETGIAQATIMNRLSTLRAVEQVGWKPFVPPNSQFNLKKIRAATVDISRQLTPSDLVKLKAVSRDENEYQRVAAALALQRQMGLRLQESLQVKTGHQVVNPKTGAVIKVVDYERGKLNMVEKYKRTAAGPVAACRWTKGGRPRSIPIKTDAQRQLLHQVQKLSLGTPKGSLNDHQTDRVFRKRVEYLCSRAGIDHRHGLRHAYVHDRFREITGNEPPVCGGPAQVDQAHRSELMALSEELGHGRLEILKEYVGEFLVK